MGEQWQWEKRWHIFGGKLVRTKETTQGEKIRKLWMLSLNGWGHAPLCECCEIIGHIYIPSGHPLDTLSLLQVLSTGFIDAQVRDPRGGSVTTLSFQGTFHSEGPLPYNMAALSTHQPLRQIPVLDKQKGEYLFGVVLA